MNLKKKIRDFFTLTRKANNGFTLVELIVVIAILAILAGVTIPVYNGYIEKTNMAADETLIAAINRAAAVAVLEARGEDMKDLQPGALVSNAIKGQTNITVYEYNKEGGEVQSFFATYFADNENQSLKWYGSLKFNGDMFVGVGSMLNGDLKKPENSNVVDAFNNSSYNSATLGVTGVTNMVNDLAGALASFKNADKLYETEKFQEVLKELGIDPVTADEQTLANAAVFYVAKCTGELDEATLWGHIKNNTLQEYLRTSGYTDKDAVFIDTALRYASATAYVHSGWADENAQDIMFNTPEDKAAALLNIEKVTTGEYEWGYGEYLADTDGQSDFHAFYEVMKTVNYNQDTFSTFEGDSLFANPELQAAMNKLLGNTN